MIHNQSAATVGDLLTQMPQTLPGISGKLPTHEHLQLTTFL